MVTINEQKLLEMNMVEAGVNRFWHTVRKMKEKGLESATKHGRVLIQKNLERLAEGIDEAKNTSSNKTIDCFCFMDLMIQSVKLVLPFA